MTTSQSNDVNNMVNLFDSRLRAFNSEHISNGAPEKLTQWCTECHQMVDEFYQRKLNELNHYISNLKSKCEEKKTSVQARLTELGNQQNSNGENNDAIKLIVRAIERDLYDIEQTRVQINLRTLNINDSYMRIEKEFSLQNLSEHTSHFSYSTACSSAIASSGQFLLMQQSPYLCLVDCDSKIVKQISWTYEWIRDICWSSSLRAFIIITTNKIYQADELLTYLNCFDEQLSQKSWFSCTCSEKSLYLSTWEWGSSIYEFNLSSPTEVIQFWKSPVTCAAYEGINDIKSNNEALALLIKDPREHKKRMDLRSTKTFDLIWSFPLSTGSNIRLFTCCSLKNNEWLVIDGTDLHIYHITEKGKMKEKIRYPTVPYRANLFGSNILAISAENNLGLYQMA